MKIKVPVLQSMKYSDFQILFLKKRKSISKGLKQYRKDLYNIL